MGSGVATVVKLVKGGGFIIKLNTSDERHFTAAGTVGSGTERRLYYHDPIVVEPPKSGALWKTYKTLTQALYAELIKLVNSGEVKLPPEADGDGDGEND
jgi:hypothetical protein